MLSRKRKDAQFRLITLQCVGSARRCYHEALATMAPEPSPQGAPTRTSLNSWKEIAGFFDVSVRTAQHWEKERGLPVYRVGTRILAYQDELEAWREAQTIVPEPVRTEPVSALAVPAPLAPTRRWGLFAAAVLCLLAIAVVAFVALRKPALPAFARIAQNRVLVLDSSGRELWSLVYQYDLDPTDREAVIQIVDLDGDQRPEVVLYPKPSSIRSDQLLCYSYDGKLRWRYQETNRVATNRAEFAPTYAIRSFVVLPSDARGKRKVAVSTSHRPYWPSSVALLDHDGRTLQRYWHGGHIAALANSSGRLLIGGVRNATNEAVLAALDPDNMTGASAEDESHQIRGQGASQELSRVTFPRSCLGKARSPMSIVTRIEVSPEQVIVHTNEADAVLLWEFDNALNFRRVVQSSLYTVESAKLDHACPEDSKLVPASVAPSLDRAARR